MADLHQTVHEAEGHGQGTRRGRELLTFLTREQKLAQFYDEKGSSTATRFTIGIIPELFSRVCL